MKKGDLVKITYNEYARFRPLTHIYYVKIISIEGIKIHGRIIHSINTNKANSYTTLGTFTYYDTVEPTTYDEIMLEEL
jgi:hypothetical protein